MWKPRQSSDCEVESYTDGGKHRDQNHTQIQIYPLKVETINRLVNKNLKITQKSTLKKC